MKKLLSILITSGFLMVSLLNFANAAEPIEFNIGDEAKSQNLPGTANVDLENPESGFYSLIGNVASVVMLVGAITVFLYMLWGAIEWISSGGDSGKLEKARQRLSTAIIGLIVLSATVALFMIIQQFLGICVLPFFGDCVADPIGPPGGVPAVPPVGPPEPPPLPSPF